MELVALAGEEGSRLRGLGGASVDLHLLPVGGGHEGQVTVLLHPVDLPVEAVRRRRGSGGARGGAGRRRRPGEEHEGREDEQQSAWYDATTTHPRPRIRPTMPVSYSPETYSGLSRSSARKARLDLGPSTRKDDTASRARSSAWPRSVPTTISFAINES